MSEHSGRSGQRSRSDFKQNSGIASGFNSGHIVTRRTPRTRVSARKGRRGRRTELVRGVIREVSGFAPYERRIMELLKSGGNNPMKRAIRFARNRLGSHQRGKAKIAELQNVITRQQEKR